jgi:hypothetical protein
VIALEGELLSIHEKVMDRWRLAEDAHKAYRDRWEHFFSLYRSYQELKDTLRGAKDRNDRDDIWGDAKQLFGTELFIPFSFAMVETILPRVVSNRPKMLILPQDSKADTNVDNMRHLIDRQQERIAYELKLQEIAKQGMIYGLGVGRTGWRRKTRPTKRLVPSMVPDAQVQWVEEVYDRVLFDDPDVAHVDIWDWRWDPFGFDMESLRYGIQRYWKDTAYVLDRLASGEWSNPAGVTLEDVEGWGPHSKLGDSLESRTSLAGLKGYSPRTDDMHEIWEYQDQDGQIVVILDGQAPVEVKECPYWHGELEWQIYRPQTQGVPQVPGIGEVEPIEQLQLEINQLRSQRRDNAAIKLMQVFAVNDGFVDRDDLALYPGALWPVNGDPDELIKQFQFGDIPNSGYQEEASLVADIERTTGVSDPVTGIGDAAQTATGVQLVQAAAGVRIQNKSRRLEVEICLPQCRQWVSMNQQMILEREQAMPAEATAMEPGRQWQIVKLTPAELAGEFVVLPSGGAMMPENEPQKRADARDMLMAFRGDPSIDQSMLYRRVLELMGVDNPQAWMMPTQFLPPIMLDILLQDFGVPEEILQQAYMMAVKFQEAEQSGVAPEGQPYGPGEEVPAENGNGARRVVRDESGRISGVEG